MKKAWILGLLAAGCAPVTPLPPPASAVRWAHVEKQASVLDYAAGDGAVSSAERVLVLAPSPAKARGRRPAPSLLLPGRVVVGEVFRIEIRVPRAEEGDRRTFRVVCGRPGLRLLDGDLAVTDGRRPALRRAIADSAGPATFDLEEIGD
jgi:hypothetical protein